MVFIINHAYFDSVGVVVYKARLWVWLGVVFLTSLARFNSLPGHLVLELVFSLSFSSLLSHPLMADHMSVPGDLESPCSSPTATRPESPQIPFHKKILLKVHQLRSNRRLCDVVLKAGETEIPSHRSVLAAVSSYFTAMFTHELMESRQEVIEIKDMPGHVLSSLIDFAYTGDIELTVDNVQEILSASSLLQIHEVQDLCCSFLMKQLDVSNCLGIKTFVEANGCPQKVTSDIDKFACRHFQQVAMGAEFLSSSAENVSSLISSLDLKVSNEEEVYSAVLEWVKQDPEERNHHLPTLLSHVRLPMLSVSYLMEKVDTEALIREQPQCRDLLDEAKRHHLLPHQRDIRSPIPRFHPRKSTVGILYAVGGKESSESITRSVEVYSLLDNKWTEATGMIVRRQQLGVGVLDGKVYAVGGSDGSLRLSSVECFDPATNFWSFVAPMGTCRSGVGVGVLGGAMCAAGGYDGRSCLNTVERFDPDKNLWSNIAHMSTRRSFPGVAVYDGQLYVFGGNDGTSFLSIVERYDPHINRWLTIPSLSKPRAGIGVAVLGRQIFVAGGNDGTSRLDSVEFLDVRMNTWQTVSSMRSARDGVSLCALGNQLIAVGGINGPSYLRSAELYNPVNNSWEELTSMQTCRAAAGVAVINC